MITCAPKKRGRPSLGEGRMRQLVVCLPPHVMDALTTEARRTSRRTSETARALLTDALALEWYAAGGGISRSGPYATQADAWEAMRYADDVRAKERCEHPRDTRVWPERVRG